MPLLRDMIDMNGNRTERGSSVGLTESEFIQQVIKNDTNQLLLKTLREVEMPQATLTAGCLFQTVWNLKCGRDPDWGIKDYDVFYYDAEDLSWEAENAVIQKANKLLGGLADKVEIRNQARVHLWYPQKFGIGYPPLQRVEDGIDKFLIECTCVGIQVDDGSVYAPNGFQDMWDGILRINPNNIQSAVNFRRKAEEYQERWPWLTIL